MRIAQGERAGSSAPALARPPATPRAEAPGSRLGALTDPRYRRYWLGSLASVGAVQLINLGQGWLIVDGLGGSPRALGTLGAATAAPAILVNLFGGVLADRIDRRRLLMWTSLASLALLATLATLDATGAVRIWHVIAVAAAMGMIFGVDWPTRNAFFPALIERPHMQSAVALNAMLWQGTRIVAPAVGGIAIAHLGTAFVFSMSAVGFATMFLILLTLRVPALHIAEHRKVLREFADGVRFIARTRLFAVLILLSYTHMFFGLVYIQLMPLIAKAYDVGSSGFGLLLTMIGLGAVSGTFVSLRLQGGRYLGRLMLTAILSAEVLILAFALAPWYGLALALVFLASVANSIFLITSMTALQMRVPDALRGRVMGIHAISFSMAALGSLLGGVIAQATDVRVAIAFGALVMTAVVLFVATTQRELRTLDGEATPRAA